jgi:hypothetical protein
MQGTLMWTPDDILDDRLGVKALSILYNTAQGLPTLTTKKLEIMRDRLVAHVAKHVRCQMSK